MRDVATWSSLSQEQRDDRTLRPHILIKISLVSLLSFVSLIYITRKSLEHATLKCTLLTFSNINTRTPTLEHRYTPYCLEQKCYQDPEIEHLVNSTSLCEGTESRQSCDFTCEDGYTPSGPANCLKGEWGDGATCLAQCFDNPIMPGLEANITHCAGTFFLSSFSLSFSLSIVCTNLTYSYFFFFEQIKTPQRHHGKRVT